MVYVQVPLEVFNTITPNGDGFNDTWKINNIESYPYCKISVFSRWGNAYTIVLDMLKTSNGMARTMVKNSLQAHIIMLLKPVQTW